MGFHSYYTISIMILSRSQQTYSIKGQLVNILGFADHIQSIAYSSVWFVFLQYLKNIKSILSLRVLQKEVTGCI